ncbi:MAG TPA: outer membrane protein transport protein [Polyangiaceae bacterium]
MTDSHLNGATAIAAGCALLVLVLAPRSARAGGFYVPEQGARAVGMGGAVVAAPGEVTGIFHNPASIATSGLLGAEVGGLLVLPSFTFFRAPANDPFAPPAQSTVTFPASKNTNGLGAVPFVGVTSNLGVENLGVGIAMYVPFGAQLSFPDDGSQRDVVTSIALQAIHVTPTVAYRFFDRLSLGAGLSYVNSSFTLDQRNATPFVLGNPNDFPNPPASSEGPTHIQATDTLKFGASFGALYSDPGDRFYVGASVMTPTTLNLRGTVNVQNPNITAMNDAQGNPLPAGQRTDNAAINIPLPAIGRFGVMVKPLRQVALEADFNYQAWSSTQTETIYFQHHYPLFPQPGAQMNDVVLQRDYHDSVSVRLGAEVTPLASPATPLKLRVGGLYDQSPIDDRHFDLTTPDSDKWGISGGAGYAIRIGEKTWIGLDASYLHLFYAERDIGPGTGSAGTILNKPASSFYYGVTRAAVDILAISASLKI